MKERRCSRIIPTFFEWHMKRNVLEIQRSILRNMVFMNEKYEITVNETVRYSMNSTDNKHYDKCINACDDDCYASYEMEILTFEKGEFFSIILLGSYYSKVMEKSGVLEDDIFYLILDNQIIKMNLEDFSYIKYSIPKPIGTYYEMYRCERGFLVYGELELVLLDKQFEKQWSYCTQDILFGANELQFKEEGIHFTDFEGNYHEVDWSGKQRKYEKCVPGIVTINMKNIETPKQFQASLEQMLCMPSFYGMNWDAYWDAITGLITLPDELILDGWHVYKSKNQEDAKNFERIMKKYNELKECKRCECIYKYYI